MVLVLIFGERSYKDIYYLNLNKFGSIFSKRYVNKLMESLEI